MSLLLHRHYFNTSENTLAMKNYLFTIALSVALLLPVFASATTSVEIKVINLPVGFEGQEISFVGNLNNWDNTTQKATVTNQTLTYLIDNITLSTLNTALKSDWIDVPTGANAGFRFVKGGAWDERIRAYFQTNDCNFRIALTEGIKNTVVIDAEYQQMPIVDQAKKVTVNGVCEDNTPANKVDPTKFTFPNGKWKALIMSYDDSGYQDRDLVRIFNTYGIVGSFNITSGALGNSDKITAGELPSLYANGNHEVALHTVSHPHLENETDANLYSQISNCQNTISGLVGYKVTGMAYPFGTYDKRTLKIMNELGIIYSRTTINTFGLSIPNDIPNDLPRWNPTCHDSSADYFGTQLINWNKEEMALLYIWGHSWEHTYDWTSLTNFCSKIGKRSDIWYAKAWDVAHYLTAVANVVKIGESGYYNPSKDVSVWVKTSSGVKELKPLETTDVNEVEVNAKSTTNLVVSPNPSNDGAITATYYLSEDTDVNIDLYDLSGRYIDTIAKCKQTAGSQSLNFNIQKAGTYLLKLKTNSGLDTEKVIVN